MANSTYLDAVTRCCLEVGATPPANATQFDDNNALPSPTLKLKLFFDSCQRMLIRTMNGKPQERKFLLNTVADQSTYDIDPLTRVESILYHSVRINTTGYTGRLVNWTYNTYRETYRDPSIIPSGTPSYWVVSPSPAEAGNSRLSQIILVPTPALVLEIEYIGKINVQPLVNATDIIMFEPEYEDVLWLWAKAMFENKLGVDATAASYAQGAVDAYRMWTKRPQEERRGVRMGVSLGGRDNTRFDTPDYRRGW